MRLVSGSSRYAIGAPSRNTTPCRFGLTIFIVGPPASLGPRGAEEVAAGNHTVRLRRQVLRLGGRRPGPGGRRSRAGGHRLRRRDELLDDEPAAQERGASQQPLDEQQAG